MITYHNTIEQGNDEWLSLRRGILTASEMKHIITPGKLQYATNEKERSHLYELAAQRISGYVEPQYVSDDMLRGMTDEIEARILYDKNYHNITECGFITNDKYGFKIGYSPDGLVGDDGVIECKSRRQKFQIESIANDVMPPEYIIQVQTGLMVSERKWCDFVTYSAGLPMFTKRIYPDEKVQSAIVIAAKEFYERLEFLIGKYGEKLISEMRLIPTERKKEEEMHL